MTEALLNLDRRQFVSHAALALAAAQLGSIPQLDVTSDELTSLGKATAWLNSGALGPAELRGKVVLIDFCTYTCINWLRQLPYVRAWAEKYGKDGLVVIGVHTPEFSFEKDHANVRRAIRDLNVPFPIAMDNEYAIWRAFENQYWPALYLIDARGRIRHRHFGEGEYERSERAIAQLLGEAGLARGDRGLVTVEGRGVEAAADWENLRTPETYLGHARTVNFASPGRSLRDQPRTYELPQRLPLNHWALSGSWTMKAEATVLNQPHGRLLYRFHARDVHLVMRPQSRGGTVRFRLSIDGDVPGASRGADVDQQGHGQVSEARMYQLIRQQRPVTERSLELEFLDGGVEVFAFTFG